MATRAVFGLLHKAPFFSQTNITVVWNKGLNIKQQRKNIIAVHDAYHALHPESSILEISSKSLQSDGLPLSAFYLQKCVPGLGLLAVENVYQGGKVFEYGGPCLDLYGMTAKAAKRDSRLHSLGNVIGFFFDGNTYPAEHLDAFYNWIYLNALLENPRVAKQLEKYDSFTDIAFNPKGKCCQARAAAIYVSLAKADYLSSVINYEDFVQTVYADIK